MTTAGIALILGLIGGWFARTSYQHYLYKAIKRMQRRFNGQPASRRRH